MTIFELSMFIVLGVCIGLLFGSMGGVYIENRKTYYKVKDNLSNLEKEIDILLEKRAKAQFTEDLYEFKKDSKKKYEIMKELDFATMDYYKHKEKVKTLIDSVI